MMPRSFYVALGTIQQRISRSRWGVALAVKARNQANRIIGIFLGEDWRFEHNGEALLVRTVGAQCTTFVDVGANTGEWTDAILATGGGEKRGILIDAASSAIALLEARFRQAGLRIVHAAAADVAGELQFYEEANAGMTSSAVAEFATAAKKTTVRAVTLDDEVDFEHVDFLKIDAEGYDFKVLLGARELISARRVTLIQFEYNAPWAQTGSTLSAAVQLLESAGYEVFLVRSDGLRPFDYARYGEFYSYANFVGVLREKRSLIAPLLRDA